jgi:signal transduction histidine kinase
MLPDTMALPAPARRSSTRPDSSRGITLAALRVPLVVKVVGANLAVVALLIAALGTRRSVQATVIVATLLAVAHLAAVLVALRPIRDLEIAAERVWHGDYGVRVDHSLVADHEVLRVASMFNILLDSLAADRARMQALAAEVIEVSDRERAALARELHESTAQHLAALQLRISVVARQATNPVTAQHLAEIRDSAEALTEEVRKLSLTVHPRVLEDLGLVPALQMLARESSTGTGIVVDVNATTLSTRIPTAAASILYRVAQESVRNAARHGSPRAIRIVVRGDERSATIEVHDDGHGFDPKLAANPPRGSGLHTLRERLALVDGKLDVKTAPNSGTTLEATIPIPAVSQAVHEEL